MLNSISAISLLMLDRSWGRPLEYLYAASAMSWNNQRKKMTKNYDEWRTETLPGTRDSSRICWGRITEESTERRKWRKERETSTTRPTWRRGVVLRSQNRSSAGFLWAAESDRWTRKWTAGTLLRSARSTGGFVAIFGARYCIAKSFIIKIDGYFWTSELTLVCFYLSWKIISHFLIYFLGFVHVVSECGDLMWRWGHSHVDYREFHEKQLLRYPTITLIHS